METPVSQRVTLVEVVELIRPFEEFAAAAEAGVRRLEAEGIASLIRIQFYVNPGSTEAGAILTFADPAEIVTHINRVKDWPEFHALVRTVKPRNALVYGKLPHEADEWLRNAFPILQKFETHLAGFVR